MSYSNTYYVERQRHGLWTFAVPCCLLNWLLQAESRLGPDGTRFKQNTQARHKAYISMLANYWSMEMLKREKQI